MIKTFLPEKIRKDPARGELLEIFTRLAGGALARGGTLRAVSRKPGEAPKEKVLNSVETYRDFLMAEDFYRYTFSEPLDRIRQAFDYRQLPAGDRHRILSAMDVTVCPYCNMNYTIQYDREGVLKSTADIDHFYGKDSYPQYALCLFNMIPSCPVCNSRLKGRREMTVETHIDPHREGFGDRGVFRVTNLEAYLLHRDPEARLALEISSRGDPEKRLENSRELFRLDARYQSVHARAEELIDKAEIYTEGYSQELEKEFRNIFGGTSIRELVFGPEETEEQYARRSLGKLRMDLLHQMGIYR